MTIEQLIEKLTTLQRTYPRACVVYAARDYGDGEPQDITEIVIKHHIAGPNGGQIDVPREKFYEVRDAIQQTMGSLGFSLETTLILD